MRTWVKWISAGCIGLFATTATAADHTDGSMAGVDSMPEADITDVYSWIKADGTTLVLIQNIVATSFSDSVQHVFHVSRQGDALSALTAPGAETQVICEFDGAGDLACWAGTTAYVQGTAPADGSGIANGDNTFRVHAGTHSDPFFFYLEGFGTAVAEVNQIITDVGAGGLALDTAGCVGATAADVNVLPNTGGCTGGETISDVLLGMLNGTIGDRNCNAPMVQPSDTFANLNLSSIVIEVDLSHIMGAGDYLQVWASTHQKPGT